MSLLADDRKSVSAVDHGDAMHVRLTQGFAGDFFNNAGTQISFGT